MFSPNYSITNSILNNIADATAAASLVDSYFLLPRYKELLKAENLKNSYLSNLSVESKTLEDVLARNLYENIKSGSGKIRDIQEIINFKSSLDFINSNLNIDLSSGFVKNLHIQIGKDIFPSNHLGEFRQSDAIILDKNKFTIETSDSVDIENELDELCKWFNKGKDNPIIKSGILQYEIMRIHPFVDANGRLGRLLSMWCLNKFGLRLKDLYNLEEGFDDDLDKYYAKLQSVDDSDDFTEWLEYYVKIVKTQFEIIQQRLEKTIFGKKDDLKKLYTKRQIKIIEFVNKNGMIQNRDFAKLFENLSEDTVLREIQELVKMNILIKVGKTRGAYYRLLTN